jgi:hypothetical protein
MLRFGYVVAVMCSWSVTALGLADDLNGVIDFVGKNFELLSNHNTSRAEAATPSPLSLQQVSELLETPKSTLQQKKEAWDFLSQLYTDPDRRDNVERSFQASQGVQLKQKSARPVHLLQDTLLVTIVTYTVDMSASQPLQGDYFPLLMNWLCFANTHGLKGVVYGLDISDRGKYTDSDVSSKMLLLQERKRAIAGYHALSKYVRTASNNRFNVVSYPEGLFWGLLANRTTNIVPRNQYPPRADYIGILPHFKRHGAILMLVPWLEILQHGYTMMFLDVDIAMVKDPVPWIVPSQHRAADISFSKEIRDCRLPNYPSRIAKYGSRGLDASGVRMTEPNTGVTFMKYSIASLKYLQDWIRKLIDTNIMNDQKTVNFQLFRSRYNNNCNQQQHHQQHQQLQLHSNVNRLRGPTPADENSLSFCMFDEYVIQNGMVALNCANDRFKGERAEYAVGMQASPMHSPVPVLLHVNYVGDKRRALVNAGLWLYRDNVHEYVSSTSDTGIDAGSKNESLRLPVDSFCCHHIVPSVNSDSVAHRHHKVGDDKVTDRNNLLHSGSNYGSHTLHHWLGNGFQNWTAELDYSIKYMFDIMHNLPANGTFVRFPEERSTSMLINRTRHPIANEATLTLLGYNESVSPIILLGTPIYRDIIQDGPEINLKH